VTSLALLGGTGALGLGLAGRFAAAGVDVLIGSRAAERAAEATAKVKARLPTARVEGLPNADAARRADMVILTVPWKGVEALVDEMGSHLAGRIVVDPVVPVAMKNGFATLVPVPQAASVGEWLQRTLPEARVVSALKNVPALDLADPDVTLAADALLCGNDAAARDAVAAVVARIPGLRPVDVGALENAHYLEAITALILNVNRKHRRRVAVRLTGLD
jgi:NADPH-dependent F420 reductase